MSETTPPTDTQTSAQTNESESFEEAIGFDPIDAELFPPGDEGFHTLRDHMREDEVPIVFDANLSLPIND